MRTLLVCHPLERCPPYLAVIATCLANNLEIVETTQDVFVNSFRELDDFVLIYYCPLNFWVRYKFRADTSHEVSALFVIFAFVPKLR